MYTGKVGPLTLLHAQKVHSGANDDHDDDAKNDDEDDDVDNDFDKFPYFEWKHKTAPEEEEEYDNEDSSLKRTELMTQPITALEDKDAENPIKNVESNVLNAPEELNKRPTYV